MTNDDALWEPARKLKVIYLEAVLRGLGGKCASKSYKLGVEARCLLCDLQKINS